MNTVIKGTVIFLAALSFLKAHAQSGTSSGSATTTAPSHSSDSNIGTGGMNEATSRDQEQSVRKGKKGTRNAQDRTDEDENNSNYETGTSGGSNTGTGSGTSTGTGLGTGQ